MSKKISFNYQFSDYRDGLVTMTYSAAREDGVPLFTNKMRVLYDHTKSGYLQKVCQKFMERQLKKAGHL